MTHRVYRVRFLDAIGRLIFQRDVHSGTRNMAERVAWHFFPDGPEKSSEVARITTTYVPPGER